MPRSIALLLLLLQIVFAALPGNGVMLCVGGEHGPFGLCDKYEPVGFCEQHGHAHSPAAPSAPDAPCEGPTEDQGGDCHACDGVHLTRGALELWQSTAAPDLAPRSAYCGTPWRALAWQPEGHRGRCWARDRLWASRRAPPPTRALEVERLTELRI